MILDGRAAARAAAAGIRDRVATVTETTGTAPGLATILVGDDPASATYVAMKGSACRRNGLQSFKIDLPTETTTEQLLAEIERLNQRSDVHGILLQHPVPHQIDERRCFEAIDIDKDVDGVTTLGFGRMAMGMPAYGSATPRGIERLLDHYGIELQGRHAVVVGRSPILGKPMAMMLLNRHATVTVCHSRTLDLPAMVGLGDLVVGALGKPEFIKAAWIKDGAVVVDAGYHAEQVGDIELGPLVDRVHAYTPVPGGVGPMTINTLIEQTVQAAERAADARHA